MKQIFSMKNISLREVIIAYLLIIIALTLYLFNYPLSYFNDSFVYISGAKNIVQGTGFYTLNPYFTNISNPLTPITNWQPGYSFCLAGVMKVLNVSVEKSVYIVNLLSWILLHLFSALIFFKLLKSKIQVVTALVLMATCGFMWQFLRYPLSDTLFFALSLGFLYVAILFKEAKNKVNQWLLLLLSVFLAVGILLTRYAGIAFIAPYFVFLLILKDKSFKRKILEIIISGSTILILFLLWYSRNKIASESGGMDFWMLGSTKDVFTFSRVIEILNYFSMAVFSIPGALLKFGFLLLIPLILFIVFLISLFKLNLLTKVLNQPVYLLISLMLLFYFSEVALMGLINSEVNPKGGFIRYFTYLLPLLLISMLSLLSIQSRFTKFYKYYILAIFVIISITGAYKTIGFLKDITNQESEYVSLASVLKKNVTPSDFVISNISMAVYAQSDIICRGIRNLNEYAQIVSRLDKNKTKRIIIVLQKAVGNTIRLDEDDWTKYKMTLPGNIIQENESYIIFLVNNN